MTLVGRPQSKALCRGPGTFGLPKVAPLTGFKLWRALQGGWALAAEPYLVSHWILLLSIRIGLLLPAVRQNTAPHHESKALSWGK